MDFILFYFSFKGYFLFAHRCGKIRQCAQYCLKDNKFNTNYLSLRLTQVKCSHNIVKLEGLGKQRKLGFTAKWYRQTDSDTLQYLNLDLLTYMSTLVCFIETLADPGGGVHPTNGRGPMIFLMLKTLFFLNFFFTRE